MDRSLLEGLGLSKADKQFDITGMGKMLEDAYLATRRPPSDRAKKSFAPSSLGYGAGKCPRRWFYDFEGGVFRESDADALSVAGMAYGTEAHERIQSLFEASGILLEKELKLTHEDPPIYGFVDLVVDWQGQPTVGEIKTTSQESFTHKRFNKKPAGYQLLQLLIYMKVLGHDRGFLLYENKNTQAILIIAVEMTPQNQKLVDDTFEWMRMVYQNWKDGQLPKRPFTRKSPACKSCDWATRCWDGPDNGVVDLPALEVPK